MRILRSLSCLALLLMVGAAEAYACSCAFGGAVVCQEYWRASAVFAGTVIEDKTINIKRGPYEQRQRLVRFSLDEPFRGVEGAQVEVLTGMGGGDCGIPFKQTQQYLVYASLFEGQLYTGICMRTKVLSAAAADLEYIRGLTDAKPGGAIFGEVTTYQRSGSVERGRQPVAGARIIIDGPARKEISTDAKGTYRVSDLPPGDYTVKISPPEHLTVGQNEQKVSLANGGCATVSYWLENDGRLMGRIFNPEGLPVNKAEVFLIASDKERFRGHWDAAYSDAEGRYAFKRIPPGRYLLSIRFDGLTSQNRPFPVMYHPGTTDRAQAKVITVGEGETIADYDLQMPPLPLEFEVAGNVIWSNGKPAPGARVEYMLVGESVTYDAKNVGEIFSFKAYEGLMLTMRASLEVEKGKYAYSDWVQVTVRPGSPLVRLILPQP